MRRFLWFLSALMVTACGKLGNPEQPDLPPIPEPTSSPTPDDESLYTSVKLGMYKRAINDDVKCSGVRAGIRLADRSTVNGEISWDDSMLVLNRPDSNSRHLLRKLWLAFDEATGFYGRLLLKDASRLAENSIIRINFGVVASDQSTEPTALYKRSILIKRDEILWSDQNGREQSISGGKVEIVDNALQFSVPSEIIEGVVLYPYWYVEALHYIDSRLTERSGLRFIQSPRTHTSQLRTWECHPISPETDEPVIQLLARSELPDIEARRQLGIARRAWIQVSSAAGQKESPLASVALMTGASDSDFELLKFISRWLKGEQVIIKLDPFEVSDLTTIPQWHRYHHYAKLAQSFANLFLLDPDSTDEKNFSTRGILANAVAAQDIQRSIGIDAQFRFTWPMLSIFVEQSDNDEEKLNISEFTLETNPNKERGLSKILGISEMIAALLSPFDLIGAIDRLENLPENERNLTKSAEIFTQLMKKSTPSFPEEGMSGWLNDRGYTSEWSPESLIDADKDGLHGFLEYALGSSPSKRDSDSDGWSDTSEYLQGTRASDSSDHPDMILADGEFGDWRFLLPNRVSVDPDQASSACAGEGNIVHYSGVFDSSRLVVMSNLERDSQVDLLWQTFFEFTVDGVTIPLDATLKSGQVYWRWNKVAETQPDPNFMSSIPISNRTLEVEIRLRDILSEQEIEKLQQVRFRVKTSSGGEACDDTQWIKLLKYQNG